MPSFMPLTSRIATAAFVMATMFGLYPFLAGKPRPLQAGQCRSVDFSGNRLIFNPAQNKIRNPNRTLGTMA